MCCWAGYDKYGSYDQWDSEDRNVQEREKC